MDNHLKYLKKLLLKEKKDLEQFKTQCKSNFDNNTNLRSIYKNYSDYENECVGPRIKRIKDIEDEIMFLELPEIDKKIDISRGKIFENNTNINFLKREIIRLENKLKEEEGVLEELEKEKLIMELAVIK